VQGVYDRTTGELRAVIFHVGSCNDFSVARELFLPRMVLGPWPQKLGVQAQVLSRRISFSSILMNTIFMSAIALIQHQFITIMQVEILLGHACWYGHGWDITEGIFIWEARLKSSTSQKSFIFHY
jgi:hypothetical protein